mgnify:CR=1 FL=1
MVVDDRAIADVGIASDAGPGVDGQPFFHPLADGDSIGIDVDRPFALFEQGVFLLEHFAFGFAVVVFADHFAGLMVPPEHDREHPAARLSGAAGLPAYHHRLT